MPRRRGLDGTRCHARRAGQSVGWASSADDLRHGICSITRCDLERREAIDEERMTLETLESVGASSPGSEALPAARRGGLRLVVTSRGFREGTAWRALKSALPDAWLEGSGFRGVLLVEAEGDPVVLGERVVRECREAVGHVTPVLRQVRTDVTAIREAASAVAVANVGSGESFCFRMRRRGWKLPGREAAALEAEIGGAVCDALARRHGARPAVDLEHPDVAIVAEVLGRRTAVGIVPKAWHETAPLDPAACAPP